jgi:hypothetical protein
LQGIAGNLKFSVTQKNVKETPPIPPPKKQLNKQNSANSSKTLGQETFLIK